MPWGREENEEFRYSEEEFRAGAVETLAELEIEYKSEDWLKEKADKIDALVFEKVELFQRLLQGSIFESNPAVLMLCQRFTPLMRSSAQVAKMFFFFGYLKGLEEGKGETDWDKVWEDKLKP